MRERTQRITFFALSMVGLLVLVFYQNCGEMRLAPPNKKVQAETIGTVPKTRVRMCLADGAPVGVPKRYLIIVDMSGSNLTTTGAGAWTGTDPTGLRFDALANFVESCASQNSVFAIVGFSNLGILPDGRAVTNAAGCRQSFSFVNGATAINQLHSMKDFNNSHNNTDASDVSARGSMLGTFYEGAFRCSAQVVDQDLQNLALSGGNPANMVYNAFFITDGRPTDASGNNDIGLPPNGGFDEILNAVGSQGSVDATNLMGAARAASSFRMTSIYYGNPSGFTDASKFLTPIAERTVANNPAIPLSNVTDLSQKLCQSELNPVRVGWSRVDWGVINLNAQMRGGQLKPDSDADGLTDEEEQTKFTPKFDPLKRRTADMAILDILCPKFGVSGNCSAPILCQASQVDALGMSECDSGSFGGRQYPYDADGDFVPDFVELIKGSADLASGRDFDLDGMSNEAEVKIGRNPTEPDSNIPKDFLIQTVPVDVTDQCIELDTVNLPVIKSSPFFEQIQSGQLLDFNHSADENVYFFYIVGKSSSNRKELRGFTVKVKPGQALDPNQMIPRTLGQW